MIGDGEGKDSKPCFIRTSANLHYSCHTAAEASLSLILVRSSRTVLCSCWQIETLQRCTKYNLHIYF